MTVKSTVFTSFFLITTLLNGQEKTGETIVSDTALYIEQLAASPNNQMVNVEDFVYGIKCDVRFATKDNPMKEEVYSSNTVFVRKPVALSLEIVQENLSKRGLGLKIFDAYRPYSASQALKDQFTNTVYKQLMTDAEKHSRGASVDVSLINLETGEEIQMPSGYFQNTEAAAISYQSLPKNVIENREILIEVMQQHGFRVSPEHWWHFDFMGWQGFSLLDLSIKELEILDQQ